MPKHTSKYEVTYEDPTPAPNARSGSQLFKVLSEVVRDDKGEFAKIVTCTSRTGANSLVNRINKSEARLPDERKCFQFTCRSNPDPESNESYLFVLYNPAGFPEEEEAEMVRRTARATAGDDEEEQPRARRGRKAAN